jgi:fanconi-associated nuclease 1
MVDKATQSFGLLKEYDDELIVLNSLLSQKYWRHGKWANWYVRCANIQNHLWLRDKDDRVRFDSLQGIKEALSDDDTGIGE